MELSTKTKGNISELKIATKLIEIGCAISFPYGENCRYDMIADYNNNLYKIQVKTGLLKDGKILIPVKSTKPYKNRDETINKKSTYVNQIDYIGSYCPQLDKCYMIHISVFTKIENIIALRINPTQNNQEVGINWAKDYEI